MTGPVFVPKFVFVAVVAAVVFAAAAAVVAVVVAAVVAAVVADYGLLFLLAFVSPLYLATDANSFDALPEYFVAALVAL